MIVHVDLVRISPAARRQAGNDLLSWLSRTGGLREDSVGRVLTTKFSEPLANDMPDTVDVDLTGWSRRDLSSLVRCLDSIQLIAFPPSTLDAMRGLAFGVEAADLEANPGATPLRNL